MREYYLWTDKYEFISINGMEITKSLNNHGRENIWWSAIYTVVF